MLNIVFMSNLYFCNRIVWYFDGLRNVGERNNSCIEKCLIDVITKDTHKLKHSVSVIFFLSRDMFTLLFLIISFLLVGR